MGYDAKNATILGLIGNIFLFIIKLIVGVLTGSIAVISEAVNSFTDILSAIVVFICVKISRKRPDKSHPFGHHRAEPIAGLVVAILAAVLGVEIINYAIRNVIVGDYAILGFLAISVLLVTILVKAAMAAYLFKTSRKRNSPAIKAMAIDCRNDVIVAATALIGVAGNYFGFRILDPIAAIVIGLYVIKQGYNIGKENIDYLVGKAPPQWLIKKVKKAASSIKGVKGVHDVKAHYVGSFIHVQVHIEVDKKITLQKAHTIGKTVEKAVISIPDFQKAFVHIDPI
ncbi:MAG: cation diffusion facilitator family transporter [Candidatus Woesearchaeota archaeon]